MTRKHTRRRVIVPQPPRGLRPRLQADQRLDLGLVHLQTLDAIATGAADIDHLWGYAGAVFTWSRVAQLLDEGMPEMAPQLAVATALLDRWRNTRRVVFTGPEYQIARHGVDVMDVLAHRTDRATAVAAADWSEARLQRLVSIEPQPETAAC